MLSAPRRFLDSVTKLVKKMAGDLQLKVGSLALRLGAALLVFTVRKC